MDWIAKTEFFMELYHNQNKNNFLSKLKFKNKILSNNIIDKNFIFNFDTESDIKKLFYSIKYWLSPKILEVYIFLANYNKNNIGSNIVDLLSIELENALDSEKEIYEHFIDFLKPTEEEVEEGFTIKDYVIWGIKNNNLECIIYFYVKNEYSKYIYTPLVAKYGNLEALIFFHKNKCGWSSKTTRMAALYGNLDCLKYAHEHKCPINKSTSQAAVNGNNLDCFIYLYKNGCQLSFDSCRYGPPNSCEIYMDELLKNNPDIYSTY